MNTFRRWNHLVMPKSFIQLHASALPSSSLSNGLALIERDAVEGYHAHAHNNHHALQDSARERHIHAYAHNGDVAQRDEHIWYTSAHPHQVGPSLSKPSSTETCMYSCVPHNCRYRKSRQDYRTYTLQGRYKRKTHASKTHAIILAIPNHKGETRELDTRIQWEVKSGKRCAWEEPIPSEIDSLTPSRRCENHLVLPSGVLH